MTILSVYVSDEDMATLQAEASRRHREPDELAEAAIAEACLAVRRERLPLNGQLRMSLPVIDRASLSRRCDGAPTCGGGECIACDAIQGEACRRPIGGAS